MATAAAWEALQLPPEVQRVLSDFVGAAQSAFGAELRSVVLFGSAAEGRLRATSDVNVVLVLSAFRREQVDKLRDPLRMAQAAIQLHPMFLLESEIPAMARGFAQKSADILRRRKVLYGADPFAGVAVPREAEVFQLQQQLMNLVLRLRAFYAVRSLREEQLVAVIADMAGPLRSCAAGLLELEGKPAESPKQALECIAAGQGQAGAEKLLALISAARETRQLPPGEAGGVLFYLLGLAEGMRAQAEKLS